MVHIMKNWIRVKKHVKVIHVIIKVYVHPFQEKRFHYFLIRMMILCVSLFNKTCRQILSKHYWWLCLFKCWNIYFSSITNSNLFMWTRICWRILREAQGRKSVTFSSTMGVDSSTVKVGSTEISLFPLGVRTFHVLDFFWITPVKIGFSFCALVFARESHHKVKFTFEN